jgi:hypothetical protein
MARGEGDAKRRLQVLIFSWLLVASAVGASGIVARVDAKSTIAESPQSFEPRFDFACEQVAVTARSYDSVTLVFADDRQTFYWSFRGRNVFFGTGENVGAVVERVVVRRDGERVTQRNPSYEACAGRNATVATTAPGETTTATETTATTATTATTVATATNTTTASIEIVANTTTGPNTTTSPSSATRRTTATTQATETIRTTATVDFPTIPEITAAATTTPETTVRGTTTITTPTAARVPTPTVTPQPIAGFPKCPDEEFGLANALNLTYEDGAFTSENATEIEENRFRFTVVGKTYAVELVEIERNEAGEPVSVTFDSTLPMDGVIVRTGQGANVYEFPQVVSRRASLRAPINANTGQPFPIEEVSFCYGPETPTGPENDGGGFDAIGVGLELLVGRGAAATVGAAAAGLLVMRRRRFA